jgi:protein-disulfide isomerase-like protein with CxxC motif
LDLNDPATYAGIMRELDIEIAVTLPAPKEVSATLAQEFAATRALGLTSYPSLLMGSGSDLRPVDLTYDPEVLVDRIEARLTRA